MIHLRQIQESDAPLFRDALDSICRERRFLARPEAPPLAGVQAFIAGNVKHDVPQFVAVEDERVVGWCDAQPGDFGTSHVGRIGMGVRKEYRRRGIGRQLMKATIKKARELGFEKLELGVYSSNEGAIALYSKFGFEEEGRKKRGRLVDGIYDDIILMALVLKRPDQTPAPSRKQPLSSTATAWEQSR
jgi:ribosomal protein S18 acetylase RimI-like enzyme